MPERRKPLKEPAASVMRADHSLDLLVGGTAFFDALVEAIDTAEREVLLETYILWVSGAVVPVCEALERAGRRGVRVHLVVDGIGTGSLPADWSARWRDAGVSVAVFNPVNRWSVLLPSGWRRLHRKLAVIDARLAFCGGINLIDDLEGLNHGPLREPRLDFAVRVTGPLVDDMHETMTRLWLRLQVRRRSASFDVEGTVRALRHAARAGLEAAGGRSPERDATRDAPSTVADGTAVAALVLRDNVRWRRRIESTYRLAINQARREVLIANAYFIPGVTLQRALVSAARRGVKVTLLLQGRYEYFMAFHASRAVYDRLLAAGIRIVEYDASFLHAKVAVMDGPRGDVATVGSSNLDPLSLLLAREANVFVRDDAFAACLRSTLLQAIEHQGRPVAAQDHSARPWTSRLLDWVAYALMRFALLVTRNRY